MDVPGLLAAADEVAERFRASARGRHHLFVPCDYAGALEQLRALRSRATTFVEFGSGAGVVTILADWLGYEAYGIELEPALVAAADELAERFGSQATFVEGSFVPLDYQDEVANLSSDRLTPTDGASAFDELGMDLTDFDLIYAYPWPGDEDWLRDLVRRHARRDALLLTYDAQEGFRTVVAGNR
jgi:predicted O-methyltransferase YrrM